MGSDLEEELAYQIKAAKLPEPRREFRFTDRRWRFDFAWWDQKLAVEVEGLSHWKSRHTTNKGFQADCEKYNTATMLGWRVLRFTGKEIRKGEALSLIERALQVD